MLIDAAHLPTVTQNDIIVTNVRHYEALNKALEAIHRVQNGLDSQISGDFLSQDIRECIFFISDIAGEVTNDMVLQNIFQHFKILTKKRLKYGKIIVLGKVFSFVMSIFSTFLSPVCPQAIYGGQIYVPLCNLSTFHYKIYLNHR